MATLALLLCFVALGKPGYGQILTPEGKVVVPPRRIDSWVYSGGNRDIIELTISRIERFDGEEPGAWTYEWRKVAAHYEARAEALAREQKSTSGSKQAAIAEQAKANYLKASLYYALGYFPENQSPEQRASFKKHIDMFVKAGQYFHLPLEVVKIPYKGSNIMVHLHRPEGVENPPLVLWSGGADWWKGTIHPEIRVAVGRGLAVAAFDLAGTGEMDSFVATPDSDDVHRTVIDYFAQHGFDPNRMAYVGTSFGGFYAVKLAAAEIGLRAVVNICGGQAFDPPSLEEATKGVEARLASPEGGTLRGVAKIVGVDPSNTRKLAKTLLGFNLKAQGIVGPGKKIQTPILNINGTRDPTFPWQGYLDIVDSSVSGELWLLGTSGHCARDYFPVLAPQLATWLVEKLSD